MEFKEITDKIKMFGEMNVTFWGCVLAGEIGELCNLLKKLEINEKVNVSALKEELAGSFIYLALTARALDIDLEEAVIKEIKKVNLKWDLKDFQSRIKGRDPLDLTEEEKYEANRLYGRVGDQRWKDSKK